MGRHFCVNFCVLFNTISLKCVIFPIVVPSGEITALHCTGRPKQNFVVFHIRYAALSAKSCSIISMGSRYHSFKKNLKKAFDVIMEPLIIVFLSF